MTTTNTDTTPTPDAPASVFPIGDITADVYEDLRRSNPIFAARFAAEHRLAERGYTSPGANMSDHATRIAAVRGFSGFTIKNETPQ